MIEPQAGITRPAVSLVVPEREHRFCGMPVADRVKPALRYKRFERDAALGLDQRIAVPGFCRVNVLFGRRDVVVAGEHDGNILLDELRRMRLEPPEPREL